MHQKQVNAAEAIDREQKLLNNLRLGLQSSPQRFPRLPPQAVSPTIANIQFPRMSGNILVSASFFSPWVSCIPWLTFDLNAWFNG